MDNNQESLETVSTDKKEPKFWANRRQRRSYLKNVGILEAKRGLNAQSWMQICASNQKDGAKRHGEYEEIVRKNIETQLSQVEQRIRVSCSEMGFDKKQTDNQVNQWMESLKPWPNF